MLLRKVKQTGFILFNKKNLLFLINNNFCSTSVNTIEKPKLKIIDSDEFHENTEYNNIYHRNLPMIIFKKSSFKKRKAGLEPTIKTEELKYSSYKLNDSCRLVRNRYIHQALDILSASHTKGSKILSEELEKFMEKAKKKIDRENEKEKSKFENENPDDTFVPKKYYFKIVEAYVGRKNGHKIPIPRAKGKTDIITRSLSRLYMHIERVGESEFLQNAAIGQSDFSYAFEIRKTLFSSGASLEMMKNYSFITTSRGRSYRKTQFLRLITYLRLKYYREKGILLSRELIQNYIKINLGKSLLAMELNDHEILRRKENLTEFDKLKLNAYKSIDPSTPKKSVKIIRDKSTRLNLFNEKFTKI